MIVTFGAVQNCFSKIDHELLFKDLNKSLPHLTFERIKDQNGRSKKVSRKYGNGWVTTAYHVAQEKGAESVIDIFDQARLANIATESGMQISFIEDKDFIGRGLEHIAI